jgi:hypothetical protein
LELTDKTYLAFVDSGINTDTCTLKAFGKGKDGPWQGKECLDQQEEFFLVYLF